MDTHTLPRGWGWVEGVCVGGGVREICLFVCGIRLTSGQLVSKLFPDCTRGRLSRVGT